MTNLLNNSIIYTSEGKIDVFIERSKAGSRSNDQFVIIQVRDTGVGIDPQMMDKLFSKFGTNQRQERDWASLYLKALLRPTGEAFGLKTMSMAQVHVSHSNSRFSINTNHVGSRVIASSIFSQT